MIYIDEEMLSWYYSILEELDDYERETGRTFGSDIQFLVSQATEVRHAITGGRSPTDDMVISYAWAEYDRQVDTARSIDQIPGIPYVKPAVTIAGWMATAMKYGMQLTGYDERVTRKLRERHHLD